MTGLDCTIIMHPQVWKCSGHYDLFHDFMVDCRESKRRYRHDQVRGRWVEAKGQQIFVATQEGGEEGLADTSSGRSSSSTCGPKMSTSWPGRAPWSR